MIVVHSTFFLHVVGSATKHLRLACRGWFVVLGADCLQQTVQKDELAD